MLIKYIGHACFKIRDNETGYSIVFDPYAPGYVDGFGDIVDSASEVLCSHGHSDHSYAEAIRIEPKEASPYKVEYIDTYHDDQKGALRGQNRIYIITDIRTGEKFIHYGDTGVGADELLTEENLELLKDADVAVIPVGGHYTIDGDTALEIIRRTTPKLTIPMHFRSQICGFGYPVLATIEDFIDKAAKQGFKVNVGQIYFYDTEANDLNDCILVLRPQNIKSISQ